MEWDEITAAVRWADWQYHYANDSRAHREGRASMVKMRDAVSYGHEKCPQRMQEIWKEYAPKGRKYPLADKKGNSEIALVIFLAAAGLVLYLLMVPV
tara:strand:+ start:4153 stop:4443 length:291 start_codon:yes stop_codon:yes gene_type:complete